MPECTSILFLLCMMNWVFSPIRTQNKRKITGVLQDVPTRTTYGQDVVLVVEIALMCLFHISLVGLPRSIWIETRNSSGSSSRLTTYILAIQQAWDWQKSVNRNTLYREWHSLYIQSTLVDHFEHSPNGQQVSPIFVGSNSFDIVKPCMHI